MAEVQVGRSSADGAADLFNSAGQAIPMKKVNEAAALHFAAGLLDGGDVPVGEHDLSRVRLTLLFPVAAAVKRDEGSEGNGTEAYRPDTINLAPLLLFLQRCSPAVAAQLKACIVEATERALKPKDVVAPDWALRALQDAQGQMQVGCKHVKKTPARRVGIANASFSIERLTSTDFGKLITARE